MGIFLWARCPSPAVRIHTRATCHIRQSGSESGPGFEAKQPEYPRTSRAPNSCMRGGRVGINEEVSLAHSSPPSPQCDQHLYISQGGGGADFTWFQDDRARVRSRDGRKQGGLGLNGTPKIVEGAECLTHFLKSPGRLGHNRRRRLEDLGFDL